MTEFELYLRNLTLQELLVGYIVGYFVLGIPKSIVSAKIYLMEQDLQYSKWRFILYPLRAFLFPFAFIVDERKCEEPGDNFHSSYHSFISSFLETYDITKSRILMYVILSSILWPGSLGISIFVCTVTVGLMCIGAPFFLLYKAIEFFCKLITGELRNRD